MQIIILIIFRKFGIFGLQQGSAESQLFQNMAVICHQIPNLAWCFHQREEPVVFDQFGKRFLDLFLSIGIKFQTTQGNAVLLAFLPVSLPLLF